MGRPKKLTAWLRACYVRSRTAGEPYRWEVTTFAPKGGAGVSVASGEFPPDGGMDDILRAVEADIDLAMTDFAEGAGESMRFSVACLYRDSATKVDTDRLTTVILCDVDKRQESTEGMGTAAMMRAQSQMLSTMMTALEAKDRALLQTLHILSERNTASEQRLNELLERVSRDESEEKAHERRLLSMQMKQERYEKALTVVSPHLPAVGDFLRKMTEKFLPAGEPATTKPLMERVQAFGEALTDDQRARAVETFGLDNLMILSQGDLGRFIEAVGGDKVSVFAECLTPQQRETLMDLAKEVV